MQEFKRAIGVLLVLTISAGLFLLTSTDTSPVSPSQEENEQSASQPAPEQLGVDIEETITDNAPPAPVPTGGSELDDELLLEDFSQAYRQASATKDRETEYRILQELYRTKQSDVILQYLIKHALYLRRFDDALEYMSLLQEQGRLFEVVAPQTFVQTLFNGRELNVRNISNIKALVHEYYEQGLLTKEERSLYFGLVAFSKGDVDNYGYFMEQLTGEYQDRKESYERTKTTVFSYVDPPPYYLDGLIALELFTRGYYQLARLSAERILRKAPSYILPHQLIAYTSLYTREWGEAVMHMQQLRELDEEHTQLYRFLQGVAYYHDGRLAESVLQLNAVETAPYLIDAYRYKLLTYAQMGDVERFEQASEALLSHQQELTPYDFYTVFDQLLYQPAGSSGVNQFAPVLPTLLGNYLDACYAQISDEYGYICLYGQAGIHRIEGEVMRAYRYLQQLVKWYPRKVIYNQLGELAFELGMEKEAKRRYIKGVLSSEDPATKEDMQEIIRNSLGS